MSQVCRACSLHHQSLWINGKFSKIAQDGGHAFRNTFIITKRESNNKVFLVRLICEIHSLICFHFRRSWGCHHQSISYWSLSSVRHTNGSNVATNRSRYADHIPGLTDYRLVWHSHRLPNYPRTNAGLNTFLLLVSTTSPTESAQSGSNSRKWRNNSDRNQ